MSLRVECYSGSKADERPIRFSLSGHDYFVDEVLDQWYGPDDCPASVGNGESVLPLR